MRKLLFLNRLALICNILFIVCLVFQRTRDLISSADVKSIIIILGWFISPFLNLAANLWAGILLVKKQPLGVGSWLLVTNLLFFILQLFIHFILA